LSTANPKVNDSLEVTIGTNNDKTGYSLTQTFPSNFASMVIDSNGRIDVSKWLGSTVNALISGRVDANAQVVGDKTGYTLVQAFPSNFASMVIDVNGRVDISKWSGSAVNALIAGKVDAINYSGESGTAQTGDSSTITLRAGASAVDNYYRYQVVMITGGTGVGQVRVISAYVGSTKIATLDENWATAPDNTSTYALISAHAPKVDSNGRVEALVADKTGFSLTQAFPTNFSSLSIDGSGRIDLGKWLGSAPNSLISGRVDADAEVVGDKTGYSLLQTFPTNFSSLSIDGNGRVDLSKWLGAAVNALISGRVDANAQVVGDKTGYSLAAGSILAATFATDAIDANALASSAADEIAAKILTTPANKLTTDASGFVTLANSSISAAKFAADAIDANALASSASDEIAAKILATPANKLATDASGFVTLVNSSITASKFAADAIDSNALAASAVSEIVTAIFGNTIDTKTFAQISEIMLAYSTGKIEKSGADYLYKKQDNTTTLFTLTASPTDRTRS
jgi:hypothetical protein